MARTRGADDRATQRTRSAKNTVVLQDVTNTKSQPRLRRTRGKAAHDKPQESIEYATAPPKSKMKQIVVARTVSRPRKTTRRPLQSIASNVRTTQDVISTAETAKGGRRTSRELQQASEDKSTISEALSSSPASTGAQSVPALLQAAERSQNSQHVVAGTPAAVEQSMLVLKSFKRRPRQPSMLNMVKQRLESARSSVAGDEALLSSDDESLDLENFLPDAAGTPMLSSGIDFMGMDEQFGKKRKRHEDVDLPKNPNASSLYKLRKLVSQSDAENEEPDSESNVAEPGLRVSVTPEVELREETNTSLNITELAAGTSPIYLSSEQGSPGGMMKQSQASLYGPPVSQHTPPPQRETRASKQCVAPSSAVLQSLLPRRRKHFTSLQPVPTFKIATTGRDSSPEAHDSPASVVEQDSEFIQTRPNKTKSKKTISKRKPAAVHVAEQSKKTMIAKTYAGRRAKAVDHDNDDGPDQHTSSASLSMADVAKNDELEAARKQFVDVDNWEMEYETLTNEDSRNSSQGWR